MIALADKGWEAACAANPGLANGLSTHEGKLYSASVGEALDLPVAAL